MYLQIIIILIFVYGTLRNDAVQFLCIPDIVAFETYVNGVFREILPLHCYPAENILQLLAYRFDETCQDSPCLIFPYMLNGSLYDRLNPEDNNQTPLTWKHRANIAVGIARGLTHLHSIPVLHGDIKSTNILLDKHMEPKIGDFGTAAIMERGVGHDLPVETHITMHNICGSVDYLPDDYLRVRDYGRIVGIVRMEVDVFCFGILLFELMSGKHPGYKIDGETLRNIITQLGYKVHGGTLRNIISQLPKTVTPSALFDSRDGLELKSFKFPTIVTGEDGKIECLMVTTTLPEQLFLYGKYCAKDKYINRPKISEVLQILDKLYRSMKLDDDKDDKMET